MATLQSPNTSKPAWPFLLTNKLQWGGQSRVERVNETSTKGQAAPLQANPDPKPTAFLQARASASSKVAASRSCRRR